MSDDDDLTTFEDDLGDDLGDDDGLDNVDDFADLDDDGSKPVARAKVSEKVKAKIDKANRDAAKREAALMGSLKEAWGAEALTNYPLADISSIGLTGIDTAAKEKFLTEMKAQHEAREHALAQAGYTRLDADGKPVEIKTDDTVVNAGGSRIAAEQAAAGAAWGKPVSGSETHPTQTQMLEKELMDNMKQGPRAVIDLMFKRVPGLSDFATRRR